MHPIFKKTLFSLTFLFFIIPLKSQTKWYWYLYTNNSDYQITGNFTINSGCNCTDNYYFSIYKDTYLPTDRVVYSTKRKADYSFVVGPNASHRYLASMKVEGKNKWSVFDCFTSCESSGTDHFTVKTQPLKPPTNQKATQDQDVVKLTWKKGTDMPNSHDDYYIYRDDPNNKIGAVTGYSFTDEAVGPGETHTYYIRTHTNYFGGHDSRQVSVVGRTRPRHLTASLTEIDKVVLKWDDISNYTDEVIIRRNNEQITSLRITGDADTLFTDSDASLIPGFLYNYTVEWSADGKKYELASSGASRPNGRINGSVRTPAGQLPIVGVEVCAELQDSIPQGVPGTTYCDTTNSRGEYTIRDIYYHEEAHFIVTPRKENHAFDPAFAENQLLELNYPRLSLDFTDTSTYIISGYVQQILGTDTCGIADIEIWLDDKFSGQKTDANGLYQIQVEESGTYTIEPRFRNHNFSPSRQTWFIEEDKSGVNFIDTRTHSLKGFVQGSCEISLGVAGVRVYSEGDNGCLDTTLITDEQGYYQAVLPARRYQVEVVDLHVKPGLTIDPEAVLSYFPTDTVDLTYEGQQRDFIYRRPPSIAVSGLPDNGCSELGYAIVEQGERYELEIEVREEFGDESCPVSTGYLLIYNEVADLSNGPDTVHLQAGLGYYNLEPGTPNLVAPHQKLLQIEAVVEEEKANWAEPLVVTGLRPREQTFTTVLPEVPLMILHDPPGDESYSFFEENQSSTIGMRVFGQATGSLAVKHEVKLGTRFEAGPDFYSVKTEKWGTIGGSLEVGASIGAQAEWQISTTNSQRFSTSNNQNITGAEGDVFIGAAMNLIYAQADILEYDADNCALNKEVNLVMGNDGFATTFMYTEAHVRQTLIPQLIGLRDYYRAIESDSAAVYDTQVGAWKQVLEQNDENKRQAEPVDNRSFSAGATYSSSLSSSAQNAMSIEVSAFMEQSTVIGAGFEIAGSGANGSVETRLRLEVGASAFKNFSTTTTTGFELKDDDPGDFFSVNIKKDPVYSTPVFELVSGRSSCPWEAGTQPREALQLQADSYVQRNIPEDRAAAFQLKLGNVSQSDEPRSYLLRFLQQSNPDGALITVGGSQVQGPIPYSIAAGAQRTATVTVTRGPDAFDYEGLQFVLSSGCDDPAIADTVALTASFQRAYPDLTLARPLDNWLVNMQSDNQLLLRFYGYDMDRVRKVQLQYSPADANAWTMAQEWQVTELSDATDGTVFNWPVSELPDGRFDLRLRADYGDGDVYAAVSSGLIDRRAPQLFGPAEPADGEWNAGDIIGLTFDEPVDCFSFSEMDIVFENTSTGQQIPVQVGCSGQQLLIEPQWNVAEQAGTEVRVSLTNVSDRNGNVLPEVLQWQFVIGENANTVAEDSDQDGIPDTDDNCTLASNAQQSDLDGDGIGDACDTDLDGDTISNTDDNCPYYANTNQADTDENGIGDVCEPEADGDLDQIPNQSDNCPLLPNAQQSDIDQDGIGDMCDEDRDGDGVPNDKDNCPDIANPDQLLPDACSTVVSTQELIDGVEDFELSPNPARRQVVLRLNVQQALPLHLSLLDQQGRVLQQQKLLAGPGEQTRILSLEAVPAGLYIVRLKGAGGVVSRKLVVQ